MTEYPALMPLGFLTMTDRFGISPTELSDPTSGPLYGAELDSRADPGTPWTRILPYAH